MMPLYWAAVLCASLLTLREFCRELRGRLMADGKNVVWNAAREVRQLPP